MKLKCSKCQKLKSISEFYLDKRKKRGFYYACKKCHNKFWGRGKEKNRLYCKKRREENREKYRIYGRWYQRKYEKKRREIDPRFNLENNMRFAIWNSIRNKKMGRRWEKLVGYTVKDLMWHLERLFDDKMSWNNYGSYWEIDHIKPRSLFNYISSEDKEFKECWALDNLQPLEATANRKKSNHYK